MSQSTQGGYFFDASKEVPMALDALLCRSLACAGTGPFILLGPLNYQDAVGAYVDEIDLRGRMGIDETWAVVLFVPTGNTVGGNGTLTLQTDDNAGFSSPTAAYTFANVVTTANGRNLNGTGPHLAGYITGPLERFLRFSVTVSAVGLGAGAVTAALTRDVPLWWRN
jgi:hypothetical protein